MPSHTPDKPLCDGWIVIDKPLHMTSNHVLGRIKSLYRTHVHQKPPKVGFSGTLDPLATGVLPIAFGQALKTMQYMTFSTKTYAFDVTFGASTTTDDAEGDVVHTSDIRPTHDDILHILPQFTGRISQTPPIYSALKIDGKRAYTLARQGADIQMKPRDITIHALTLVEYTPDISSFHVVCSAGTYVRSLGRDIARALGSVGYISKLRRTQVGCFDVSHAMTLDDITENLYTRGVLPMHPIGIGLDDILAVSITRDMYTTLIQGRWVRFESENESSVVALWLGSVCAGFGVVHDGFLKPKRMINI